MARGKVTNPAARLMRLKKELCAKKSAERCIRGGRLDEVVAAVCGAWGVVDVGRVGVGALKKEREVRFRKRAKLRFRYRVMGPAPYLAMSREVARAVARFRLRFGPDKVSLMKRGLLRVDNDRCRWCGAEKENAGHLLFACIGLSFLTYVLWKFDGLEDILADGSDWGFVGPVLRDVYCMIMEKRD